MKYAICAALLLSASSSLAGNFVAGESTFFSNDVEGKQQIEFAITGKSAEALYLALDAKEHQLTDEHSGLTYGAYKAGKDLSCTQTYGSYTCTVFVDETGAIRK